jgi:hypothetical protein
VSDTTVAPEHDCPPCASCGEKLGTPIKEAQVERFAGPADSTLFCPMCGAGWVGSAEDLAQARAAWAAYEATLEPSHEFKPTCVMCFRKHPCPDAQICKVCGKPPGGSVHR